MAPARRLASTSADALAGASFAPAVEATPDSRVRPTATPAPAPTNVAVQLKSGSPASQQPVGRQSPTVAVQGASLSNDSDKGKDEGKPKDGDKRDSDNGKDGGRRESTPIPAQINRAVSVAAKPVQPPPTPPKPMPAPAPRPLPTASPSKNQASTTNSNTKGGTTKQADKPKLPSPPASPNRGRL